VFLAAALARQGYRVAVVERAELRGRSQEWNISRKELEELREVSTHADCVRMSCVCVRVCMCVRVK
jgi:lycopene cyclase CruP